MPERCSPDVDGQRGWLILVPVLFCLLASAWLVSREQPIEQVLFRSRCYRELQKSVQRPAFLFDGEDETYLHFRVGENFPDRFRAMGSLRVHKTTSRVSRLVVDGDLELVWVNE